MTFSYSPKTRPMSNTWSYISSTSVYRIYEKMNVLRKSTFTVKKFCCGVTSDGNTDNFIKNFIQDLRANEKDARLFKCNENVLSNVESVSQRYITIFLYVSAFFFYFTALIIPLT